MSHKQISQEQSYHHVCMQQISQKSYPHYVCRSVSSHTTSMYAADQSGEVIPPVCMQISQDKSYHQYICSISVRSIRATSMYAADRSGAVIPPVCMQQFSQEHPYHLWLRSSHNSRWVMNSNTTYMFAAAELGAAMPVCSIRSVRSSHTANIYAADQT